MQKIIVLFTLATFIVASVPIAESQQPKKVPRIGYLSSGDPARESTRAEAIRLLCASVAT